MKSTLAHNIWYISKYAVASDFGNPTRQFLFSKYMAKTGRNVTLISSRSVSSSRMPNIGYKNEFKYEQDGVKGILLNGPIINLGFNPKRIYSWFIFEFRLLYWALFRSGKDKPDAVIVSSLSLLTFLSGIILKNRFKCKLICEVRDIWPLTIIESKNWSKNNPFILFLAFVERLGYRKADVIIGTMPNLKAHVSDADPSLASKVRYIPMGFDVDIWNDLKDVNNSIFNNIPDDCFKVGYAGTIGLANCVDQIIEAAAILKDQKILFLILGEGPLKSDLQKSAEAQGLNNVVFLDAVPKEQVSYFLKRCDLLLNPWKGKGNLYKFGVSPNKWIDYMYSERPILVSLNGFPSILNDAGCGKFIEADNPIKMAEEILSFSKMPKTELAEMGKKGKAYLIKYLAYPILTERYLEILDN